MFTVACILLASLCVVEFSSVSGCSETTFNVVEDETASIRCFGLPEGQDIYWSVTGPSTGGQETRIGDCSRCNAGGSCSCNTNSADYIITRNGYTSRLYFANNLPAKNRSTIRCSTEDNATCAIFPVNILKAPVRCQHSNNCIEIIEDQPTPLTCRGAPGKAIYWSVTRPSTSKTAIGFCLTCVTTTHLPCTCFTCNGDYSITRTGDITTAVSILQFVNNVLANDNSTIKCSTSDDNVLVSANIDVIPAYRFTLCSNNTIIVFENSERRLRCEGMESSQSMYWSITYPNDTEQTVAVCGNCENGPCPQCDVKIGDFSVERNKTFSVLRMTAGNDRDKDGAVVKCSEFNNATHDQCQLSIQYYALPQCTDGRVYVSETEPHTHITCDGVNSHRLNWTLTADSGQLTEIAECYGNGTCTKYVDDVTVSKNESASTLTFVKNVRQGDNQTLNCVRRNGETSASCRIRTFYPGAPENSSLVVDSNYTVTGRVHVNKVYEPDGRVACLWYHSLDNGSTEDVPSTAIHLNLSSFTDGNRLQYQRGTCIMTMQLNASEMTHYFHVEIQPGGGRTFADTVTIVKPGPNLTTTCPDYVTEGRNLTCECSHLTAQHGNPPATISWRDVTDTKVLNVPSVDRNLIGTVFVCTSVWGEATPDEVLSSKNYTLLVEYPGAPDNTSLVVDSNFTVTGRVHVNKVYEPDGRVECLWYHSLDNVSMIGVPRSTTHLDLSPFTDVNGLKYQRGICTMTMQLNASEMTHYFDVEIQPGGGPRFAESVTIKKPGTTLTTTCPDYVSEGSDLTCECSHLTAQHGNPPATISWRDVTDTAALRVPSVHRNQNGTQFVCTSVWGAGTEVVNSTNIYTLLVAYDDPEPFPWVVVGAAVGATVLVIIVVIAIVVVVYRRRAHIKGAVENNAGDNASDDDFEEHTNDLYQSSDLDTPFQLQPLQASTAPQVSNTVSADTNGIQEMTQTAQTTNDVYNVLGSTPHGDQKADAVYNHLTKC